MDNEITGKSNNSLLLGVLSSLSIESCNKNNMIIQHQKLGKRGINNPKREIRICTPTETTGPISGSSASTDVAVATMGGAEDELEASALTDRMPVIISYNKLCKQRKHKFKFVSVVNEQAIKLASKTGRGDIGKILELLGNKLSTSNRV